MGELQQLRNKNDLPFRGIWLIDNNSKSFANGSKPTTRKNLGFCKHFEIFLILLSKTLL